MKVFLALLAIAALAQAAAARKEINRFTYYEKHRLHREPPVDKYAPFNAAEVVEEKWIQQPLNHFDPQDTRVWQMRYLENREFLQDGGPIFIYVGGEWTVSEGWLRASHFHDMAEALNGTMYYTEHRYYGESRPTDDLTTENLAYLNIDQALADLAYFIVHEKQTNPELANSGVILIGASYSATMVTWFMQKYPHLANGAWSSSAPLKAKVDFVEYKEVVSEALEIVGGANCTRRIRNAFEELEAMFAAGNATQIEELFSFCHPFDLTNDLDVWSFFSDVAGPWSGIVQYHREYNQDIQQECEFLVNQDTATDLEALIRWWWYPGPSEGGCYDHRYELFLYWYSGTGWDDPAAWYEIRQWYYQTCAEYGWYQSSGSDNILFGSNFPANLSLQICADLYSGIFTPEAVQRNVDRTNIIYGSLNPNVRNVYSTHGQLDPWRAMGVQEDINEWSPTVILPLESHCSDLYARSSRDTPEMTASKNRIWDLVHQWLGFGSTTEPASTTTQHTIPTAPEYNTTVAVTLTMPTTGLPPDTTVIPPGTTVILPETTTFTGLKLAKIPLTIPTAPEYTTIPTAPEYTTSNVPQTSLL